MTSADVLRLLELGVPTSIIIERVRSNNTRFTRLDELFAGIRGFDRSGGADTSLLALVTEVSASRYRGGSPCASAGATCLPLPAAASGSAAPNTDPQPTAAHAATAPAAPKSPAAAAGTSSVPRSQSGAVSSAAPAAPEATPATTPQASSSSGAAQDFAQQRDRLIAAAVETEQPDGQGSPTDAVQEFIQQRDALIKEEIERGAARHNPNLAVTPIRYVFQDTEVGEQRSTNLEIVNTSGENATPAKPFRILSIRLSLRDQLDQAPDSFSLAQPDLQCPIKVTGTVHCHLNLVFHPVREQRYYAYISIVSQDPDTNADYYDQAYISGAGYVSDVARAQSPDGLSNNPSLRSVMGFDLSGASNAQTQQKFFLEFNMNVPVWFSRESTRSVRCDQYPFLPECSGKSKTDRVKALFEKRDPLSRYLWVFLNPRITSVPQSPTSLAGLNIQSISDSITGNNKTTSIVQGLDVTGGLELFLIRPRQGLPFWSSVKNAHGRVGVALVAGAGFTTPFSPPDKTTQEFTINSTILKQFPNAANPQNGVTPTIIAFVDKERSRFFRRYYGGFRFKTYFFSDRVRGDCDDPRQGDACRGLINMFPGVIDITTGKDEAVTGGRFANWVLRLDAVYPLPFIPAFHIFGGANLAFGRNTSTLPLTLEPPPTFLNFSNSQVFVQPLDPPNRDTYRIGLGVDLLDLIKTRLGKPKPPAAASASASQE